MLKWWMRHNFSYKRDKIFWNQTNVKIKQVVICLKEKIIQIFYENKMDEVTFTWTQRGISKLEANNIEHFIQNLLLKDRKDILRDMENRLRSSTMYPKAL